MRSRFDVMRVAGVALLCLFTVSGCGVTADLTSSPDQVPAGEPVTFTIKLTNPSQCPVGHVAAELIPFIRLYELTLSGDPDIDSLLHQALAAVCAGQSFELPGLNCRVENGELICDMTGGDTALDTSGEVTLNSPLGALLRCQREGSRLTCKIPSFASAMRARSVRAPMAPFSCIDVGDQEQLCEVDQIAPGASVMTDVQLTAPLPPHLFANLLVANAEQRGVCKDGSQQGEPCADDSDCTGGSVGSCASGICVDNTTQATGAGCNTTGDCGANQSCVQCQPDQMLNVALDCTQTQVLFTPPVPAVSKWGVAASVLVLLAVAFVGLRMRPRIR